LVLIGHSIVLVIWILNQQKSLNAFGDAMTKEKEQLIQQILECDLNQISEFRLNAMVACMTCGWVDNQRFDFNGTVYCIGYYRSRDIYVLNKTRTCWINIDDISYKQELIEYIKGCDLHQLSESHLSAIRAVFAKNL
jgi:hypothetical protein